MRVRSIATLSAVSLALVAPIADAQDPGEIAINACQAPAERELRGPHPEVDSIRFSPGARLSHASNAETGVAGDGQYFETGSNLWKSFTYKCTYNIRSGETYAVTATFVSSADSTPPVAPDGAARTATNACQGAVYKEVRTQYADAVNAQFSSGATLRELNSLETSVSGVGQFQTNRSDWKSFSYECVYNTQSGRTSGVSIRVG